MWEIAPYIGEILITCFADLRDPIFIQEGLAAFSLNHFQPKIAFVEGLATKYVLVG